MSLFVSSKSPQRTSIVECCTHQETPPDRCHGNDHHGDGWGVDLIYLEKKYYHTSRSESHIAFVIFVLYLSVLYFSFSYILMSRISDLRISLYIFFMKNPTTEYLHDLEEHFFLSGNDLKDALRWSPPRIEHIIKRWNHLKKEEVLSDMDQILRFSEPSKVPFLKRNSVYREMELLLFKLQGRKWWKFYSRVITIIEKYLKWIKRFLSGSEIREIRFYTKLFEWTMIAIIEEVKTLEEVRSIRVFG